jgi:hypothetical protein
VQSRFYNASGSENKRLRLLSTVISDDAFASGNAAGDAFATVASTIAKRGAKTFEETILNERR